MYLPINYNEIDTRIEPLTKGIFEQYIKDKKYQAMKYYTFSYNKN